MRSLEGRRVALLETRKAADVALLVERLGGTAVPVESVREVRGGEDVRPALARLASGGFDWLVVLTAAAAEALFADAEQHGVLDDVLGQLRHMKIACRGPKPLLALRRRELAADVVTARPHTTEELLTAFDTVDLSGARALLLHYGEQNEACASALVERGAAVTNLSLYQWALPVDVAPLETLVRDTIARRVDAVLFTSQIQFRHLLEVARAIDSEAALIDALRDHVVVGSVGPVCSRAIRAAGLIPDVMPGLPNATSLVQAVAEYLSMFNPGDGSVSKHVRE